MKDSDKKNEITRLVKINRTVREILQPKLVGMSIEDIADALMCDDIMAKAILDGTIDMTITHLVVLCKLCGFEPHDVIKVAIQHNVMKRTVTPQTVGEIKVADLNG